MPDRLPTERITDLAVDRFLDSYAVPGPSSALIGQILASAPYPRALWSKAMLWWSGLGLAGVGMAGVLAGALAISIAAPMAFDRHAMVFAEDQQTAFDNADVEGSGL